VNGATKLFDTAAKPKKFFFGDPVVF